MALAHCYRILGLRTGASFGDVKLAYRNLARLYHPDTNPGDQLAKDKFIQVTQAYHALADARPNVMLVEAPAQAVSSAGRGERAKAVKTPTSRYGPNPKGPNSHPSPEPEFTFSSTAETSVADQDLKHNGFKQLRGLFRSQRFPRAVALVEGLAHRFPTDPEVRQWYAITYYRWGHDLITSGNFKKAEACLKKAWRVDPHNKSLRQALEHDFKRLEVLSRTPVAQAQ